MVCFSATYYISPNGSDSSGGTSPETAWRTFQRAFSTMAGGSTLVLLNGTYVANTTGYINGDGVCASCALPPSGTSLGNQTIVRALNPGSVTINGKLKLGTRTVKVSYVRIQGITFEGGSDSGGQLYNTSYVTIKECGFHATPNGSGSIFSIGTNDHNNHNNYNLIEDCWIWGRSRIIAINYRDDFNVWRRVVVRGDGCSSIGCQVDPNVGITVYNSSNVSLQNIIVVDRILDAGAYSGADFGTAQHAPAPAVDEGSGEYLGPNEWLGCISLHSQDKGYYFEADLANANTYKLLNVVAWDTASNGINLGGKASNVFLENITVGDSKNSENSGDNIRLAPQVLGGTLRNVIAYQAGRFNINSSVAPSYSDVYGAASANYNQTSCQAGCQSINPLTGTPPPLRYIVRIEDGSALKGTGSGGKDYGANIVKRYGVDGSMPEEPNFDVLTNNDLWPWPNEARLKAQMCANETRGFCSAASLTEYVWEYLGNSMPAPSPTPTPSTCSGGLTATYPSAQWQNQAFNSQSGTFTAEADVTPSASNVDASINVTNGAQTTWSALATTVRFNPNGYIDAINGGAYTSSTIPYTANSTYHIRMVIDVLSHLYSAYVTAPGSNEQAIGTNLSFRTGQATVTNLNNWTVVSDAGSLQACSLVTPPQSQTRTFQQGLDGYAGVTDTWLNFYDPNLNFNNESKLSILGGSENAKVLLRFDLASIPANAVIISATLSLYNYSHEASANGGTLSVHRVDRQWVEAQATWNVYSSGNNWTAAGMQSGTDYVSSPANSITIDTSTNVWRSFDVTTQIQQWVSGAAQNRGFVMRSPTYGVKPNFHSSGYLVDPSLRPKMSITYQ